MPSEGQTKKFMNHQKTKYETFMGGYLICFDFESLQVTPEKKCGCSEEVLRNTERERKRQECLKNFSPEDLSHVLEQEKMKREVQINLELAAAKKRGEKNPKRRDMPSYPIPRSKLCTHRTFVKTEQPAFIYRYIVVDRRGTVVESDWAKGEEEEIAYRFVKQVIKASEKWLPSLSPGKPMLPLTPEEEKKVKKAKKCYLCQLPLGSKKEKRLNKNSPVRDHDHISGEFLGVAHSGCNLLRRESTRLTCFAHNFSVKKRTFFC